MLSVISAYPSKTTARRRPVHGSHPRLGGRLPVPNALSTQGPLAGGVPVKRLVIDELGIAEIIVPEPELFRRYLAALTEFDDESLADVHLSEELTADYITDDGPMTLELCEEDGFISWRRLSAGAR
ncbi:hypothetical protein [Tessaracoccus palaemonis]|uniref:Uncharacterized protein n=1 Tax=Tessaracoccus palaemonis TaxID=2829499 RepID=A0ABX8SE14_9ACTN|nr:hypothetical protein [Tessaracoccus palaemonis]QXT61642.1 hypothetical protein KDB89_07415 [Tessaracoccus palaemonis]